MDSVHKDTNFISLPGAENHIKSFQHGLNAGLRCEISGWLSAELKHSASKYVNTSQDLQELD